MSFNFGNTSTLGSTSTPAKPNAFGSFSFGAQASTPAFGAGNTGAVPTFGATTGVSAFGATTTSAFGAPAAGVATTGTGFGSLGFGNTAATGTTASTASTFGFGTNAGPMATPAFGGFGTSTTSTTGAPAFGSFGATTATSTSAPAFGSFGSTAVQPFGSTSIATSSAPSFFGGLGTTQPTGTAAFGGFGSGTTFGGGQTTFGQPTGGLTFGQPSFGQQQQQQQLQQFQALSPEQAFIESVFNVSIFADERDTVLAKWNYLQAMLGTGKSFYSQQVAPVEITPSNFLCRFKTMSYSKLPGKENKFGLVGLTINKTAALMKEQQQQFIVSMNQIFGNKPNVMITVDSMKPISDAKVQLVMYIEEKSTISNETKRVLATEVAAYLNQPMPKQQLSSLGIESVVPLVLPEDDQLKEYLDNPPKGIDPRMWEQAKIDNPDPKRFIPVPMIGFQDLKWRIKCQETETEIHAAYLAKVEKEIGDLKQRHINTTAKVAEHRRNFTELSHRILRIIVKQESTRKLGLSLSPEEEAIRSKLENMHALVSTPTQFRGRLSELLSQMRMQRNQWAHANFTNEYTLDKEASHEMQSFLTMQQKAVAFLIDTINGDMKTLKVITDGMTHLVQG
ncbi:probable nucleoporin Nup54 [Anopheles bellator]|uniref:probable nucleoporin Nup54 n=1 Tax=Anopheles bellator TaxID=139047 RepID=UPI00264921C7|nr:probable nucleoporin Nup54 [Anopheles bellator]XP_058065918.1 probable nucleoporin Nup54 [Anopheles bellator]